MIKFSRCLVAIVVSLPLTSFASDFDGFYGKAVFGGSSAKDHGREYRVSNSMPNGLESKGTLNGTVFGLSAGYNKTLTNQFLVGVEVDFEGRGAASDNVYQEEDGAVYSTNYKVKSDLSQVASLRARTGYVFDEKSLLYVTAGYTTARIKRTYYDFRPPPSDESSSRWQSGWTVGFGGEYLIARNLSAGLEFRYSDFGNTNVTVDMWDRYEKHKLTEKSVRAGISFRF